MTIEEVKQIITNSRFEAGLKQRLFLALSRLGKYTLSGLGKEVSRGDSLVIADYLVSLWESFANLLEGLKNKDTNAVKSLAKFLVGNLSKFNGEDELYFLYFVLDLRALAYKDPLNLTTEQYRQLLDFEIKLFWDLPKEEIIFLLQNHLLFLESRVNLLMHMQVVTWGNDWDYMDNFSKFFSDLLYQNKEILGVNTPKTVGAWVKEFFNFSSPTFSQTTVVGVAEFLVKDPAVQKLTNVERKTLSEILKLFSWILDPEMNEEEVLLYREQIRTREAEKIEQLMGIFGQSAAALEAENKNENVPEISTAPLIPLTRPTAPAQNLGMDEMSGGSGLKFGTPDGDQQVSPVAVPTSRDATGQASSKYKVSSEEKGIQKISNQKPMPPRPQGAMANDELRIMNEKKQQIDRKLEELKKKLLL
ncbi:MAG: hypothetical protein HYZ51_05090 [Candidatus Doudnabacteria bacterium]|nr:hypothetical protein [Candidatus Doudnabacteria bacterium]